MKTDYTDELLKVLAVATTERKKAALRVLRDGPAKPLPQVAEHYLTLKEVAAELKVSIRSLKRWRVPRHRFGVVRRCRLSEVVAYLESEEFEELAAALRAERAEREP